MVKNEIFCAGNRPVSQEIGHNIDGLEQDCSNSSALAMELLQSYAKSSIYKNISWLKKWSFSDILSVAVERVCTFFFRPV